MDLAALHALPGTAIPAGRYRIPGYQSRLMYDIVHADPQPHPHPIYGFVVAQGGLGCSVDELLALFGASGADGPMLGSCALEFHAPLRVDEQYEVTGEVLAAERKTGRTVGTFDLVTFRLVARRCGDGELVVTATNSFVLPRATP